jgi:hypothetical protein
VLGSTVFREQIVSAATTPFQQVVVQNTSTNPVPVTQVGTSTTSVTGTVGIDPSKNTVNLGSTDSGHLANIDNAVGNLHFDSSGSLKTTGGPAAPGEVTDRCLDEGIESVRNVPNDSKSHTLCTDDFYATTSQLRMDDNIGLFFYYQGNLVLVLNGSGTRRGLVPARSDPSAARRPDRRRLRATPARLAPSTSWCSATRPQLTS